MGFRARKHPRPTVDASVWAAPATDLVARRTATLFGRPRCQPTRYISACVTAIGRTSTGIIILYHSTAADRHEPRTTTSKSPVSTVSQVRNLLSFWRSVPLEYFYFYVLVFEIFKFLNCILRIQGG